MEEKLIRVIAKETNTLEELLSLLEEQYKFIMNKDVFSLEDVVDKIKECNKEVAKQEINRRKLVGNVKMREIVRECNSEKLDKLYRNIKKLIQAVQLQKDTNELLIRQQLSFTNQILNVINPRRDVKTYTSMGSLSR